MIKSISTGMICLIITAMMFTGATTVFAAESSSPSPYEMFKDAIFNAFTHENATMQGTFTLSVNGQVYEAYQGQLFQGNGRQLSQNNNNGRLSFDFQSEALRLRTHFIDAEGTQWYSASTRRWDLNVPISLGGIDVDIRSTNEFRLGELAFDLVVGDLTNNFVLTYQDDDTKRISWNISEYEIPEIVEVLIDMMIEWNNRRSMFTIAEFYEILEEHHGDIDFYEMFEEYYGDIDIFDIPIVDATINHVYGYIDLDDVGNLASLSFGSTATLTSMFGRSHTIEVVLSVQFSDFGTTDPQSPIMGALGLFTPEFMELNHERPENTVYFTRNIVGSINRDSITTENPMWSRFHDH